MGPSWASWRPLGASWEALGALLGPLGSLLWPLGTSFWFPSFPFSKTDPKLLIPVGRFGAPWGTKMAPKWDPKRTKIEDKIEHQKNTSLRPSWGRLVAILGRSWPHLGVNFGHFSLENVMFRENLGFRENVVSRPVLGRSWPDLGAQKSQNGPHMGPQKGPKTSPKPC